MNFLDKITRTAAALLVASLIVTFVSACAKTVSNMEITHMVTERIRLMVTEEVEIPEPSEPSFPEGSFGPPRKPMEFSFKERNCVDCGRSNQTESIIKSYGPDRNVYMPIEIERQY
jgi:hypothetical protein